MLTTTAPDSIIALEGLGTNAFGTFRAPQGDEMWLRDYVKEIIPRSRVLLYGYESSVIDKHTKRSGLSSQNISQIATNCRQSIVTFRELTFVSKAALRSIEIVLTVCSQTDKDRPIIWIGQSMGGLVIQEVIKGSNDQVDVLILTYLPIMVQVLAGKKPNSTEEKHSLIKVSVGLLGYGIPMHGLRNEALRSAVRGQPNAELIQDICIGEDGEPSEYLRGLADRFGHVSNSLELVYFYETNPTRNRLVRLLLPCRSSRC